MINLASSIRFIAVFLFAVVLSACGGGGGNASTPVATTTTAVVSTLAESVSSISYVLDKSSVSTSSSDKTTLTVTVLDSSNNPISGVTTTVALSSGIYTPANTITNSNGLAIGYISAGSDKSNRIINAVIAVSKLAKPIANASINVSGTSIALTATPPVLSPGQAVKLDVKVTDAGGVGVPNSKIAISGTLGVSKTVTTDLDGVVTLTSVPSQSGADTYSVIATGSGATSTSYVSVVSGSVPEAATSDPSAKSLAAIPNSVAPNTDGATKNQSTIRAIFQDGANRGIPNMRVRFEITSNSLGANEKLTTGSSIVYSDSNGVATTNYVPDTRSSPTNGVTIRACYAKDDISLLNNQCPQFVVAKLTVASSPLSIAIGQYNLLEAGPGKLTYIQSYDIAVADSAGNPVQNAVVSASVDITHYGKGGFRYSGLASYPDGTTGTFSYPQTLNEPPPPGFVPNNTVQPGLITGRIWCANEDTNRNGFLDVGEDINANSTLEPRKSNAIVFFPESNKTDSTGRLVVKVQYPQSVATWIAYTLKVTTSVAGSEGTDQRSILPSYIEGDEKNGAFLSPPYGLGSCVSAN